MSNFIGVKLTDGPAFVDSLWRQITESISTGRKSILFWGFNDSTIELVRRMNDNGLANSIVGIIDSNPSLQGLNINTLRVLPPDALHELEVDTMVVVSDKDKEQIISSFSTLDNRMPKIIMAGTGHLEFKDSLYEELISSSFVSSRAFGYKNMLIHIYQCLTYIAKNKLEGNIAEFGVYKGGTTVFMARAVERLGIKAKIFAFDTFAGFPPRKSVLDMYDDTHDEFFDFQSVANHCKPYNIELITGDITETFHRIKGVPLVLSFFDTDNYSPTKAALDMCYQQTVRGGIMAFDHYYCDERWLYTLGERIAAKEFFADKNVLNLYGTGIFIKL